MAFMRLNLIFFPLPPHRDIWWLWANHNKCHRNRLHLQLWSFQQHNRSAVAINHLQCPKHYHFGYWAFKNVTNRNAMQKVYCGQGSWFRILMWLKLIRWLNSNEHFCACKILLHILQKYWELPQDVSLTLLHLQHCDVLFGFYDHL